MNLKSRFFLLWGNSPSIYPCSFSVVRCLVKYDNTSSSVSCLSNMLISVLLLFFIMIIILNRTTDVSIRQNIHHFSVHNRSPEERERTLEWERKKEWDWKRGRGRENERERKSQLDRVFNCSIRYVLHKLINWTNGSDDVKFESYESYEAKRP